MNEIYKIIPGYEDYQVSNLGNIKSMRFNKERILKFIDSGNGYYKVQLYNNKKPRKFWVHRLVLLVFTNKFLNYNEFMVDHINNIKTDNKLINLQFVTNRYNSSKDKKNKTSQYTGVSLDKKTKLWRAVIQINKKNICLGSFKNEIDANNRYQLELLKLK